MTRAAIAIVGMACEYPDARSPVELFENALAGRRAFRRIPDERLPLAEYGSDDPGDVDATTVRQAAVLDGWSFDRLRFKTVGSTYRSADPTHWLALDVADRALRDAGFADGEGLPRARTGVVIGNTLTGEFSRAQALRLRWPYVLRVLEQSLSEKVEEPVRKAIVEEMERRYKAPFEPFGDESLAGGLANTIAGRVCNYFDLHGGGFTVDGACASSLLAVANACSALAAGELDIALAGGVDLSLDPFELVGFARAGALARDEMRVYDQRAEGFWPGEGCGVVVLMREEDARAQGRPIHARIRGWGIASDGAGGISRPEPEGQLLALRRAYERAGIDPSAVGYFEGHGTGTVVGDAAELTALTRLLQECGAPVERPTPIASIKVHIGHTKAAAGIAGLIRTTCALEHQIVPSLPACERPDPRVDPARAGRLRVLARAEAWPCDRPRCAGVSSMGFGGINTHVVLDVPADTPRSRALSPRHAALVASAQDVELFLLHARDAATLGARLEALARSAARLSRAELADCAAQLAASVSHADCARGMRAAITAATPEGLASAARRIGSWLAADARPGATPWRLDVERGCFLGTGAIGRIGLLFPGQAAPVRRDLGAIGTALAGLERGEVLARHRAATAALTGPLTPERVDTRAAQPAIVSGSLAGLRLLEAIGVVGQVAVGHSVGEIGALAWAGALSDDDAMALATERGRIMSERAVPGGAMASLATTPARAEVLAKTHRCRIAAVNGPRRCVVAGDAADVERVIESAREQQIAATRLPVSHAFHSPAMAPCIPAITEHLDSLAFTAPARGVISTRTGAPLEPQADLRDHLVRQLSEPVRFADAVEAAAQTADLFLELGPGEMLSSLAGEFLDAPILSIDAAHGRWQGLLSGVAAAFALGAAVRPEALFGWRIHKPFDPDRAPVFLVSPCGLREEPLADAESADDAALPDAAEDPHPQRSALQVVRDLVAARCELPFEAVGADDRFLSDLHLSSIAVAELASRAARALGRPPLVAANEFADATVGQLAEAIDSDERSLTHAGLVSGVDSWVRPFSVVWEARPVPRAASGRQRGEARWHGFAPAGSPIAERLARTLACEIGGEGVLIHLPRGAGRDGLRELLSAAKATFGGAEARSFVLVHHGDPAVAIARSLHQEIRSLTTRVIELPDGDPQLEQRVLDEVRGAAPFIECRYDGEGRRFERRLETLAGTGEAPFPLGAGDVLLVTGGGKGIAAECAISIAIRSGCALALLGRARPADDEALRASLARCEAERISFRYASADVGLRGPTLRAIDELEHELGPITALLHGAGVNQPRSLAALELEHIEETLAPKADGLRHLLARLDGQLRCVVGFGSVIAEIGLPGEAHYAYANELLTREIERFAQTHPAVRCLSVEWSVWSGVGMGDRLGQIEILAANNISAISPEVGCAWLERLLSSEDLPVRLFLSGRFGNPATLAFAERPLPVRRFVEHVREYTPGVELVVDAELSHESDPWLADHVYRGEPLVPGVLGLEAMAQVAMALAGAERPPRFDDVRFLLPVVVPGDQKSPVRIAALQREPGRVELSLRANATGYAADHMRATAIFDVTPNAGEQRAALPVQAPGIAQEGSPAPELDPERELYDALFFHGERFRRVRRYEALHWNGCRAQIDGRDGAWFGSFQPQTLELGDPGARDAAVHAIQACLPHREVLPVGVEQIEFHRALPEGTIRLVARERSRSEGSYLYDLGLFDAEGGLLECWRGLTLRAVDAVRARDAWVPALLGPHLEEIANTAVPGLELCGAVVAGGGREASERAFAIARGERASLRHRGDGKPLLAGVPFASASHAVGLTLAVVAAAPVACDLEAAAGRSAADWADLLDGERLATAQGIAALLAEPFDHAATRVWGIVECLRKLGCARETPILLEGSAGGDSITLAAGRFVAISWRGALRGASTPVVATILGGGRSGDAVPGGSRASHG